jgi:hypothetical protein
MNRAVDKKKFLDHLRYNPASVKKIVNPTEDFLVECVTASFSCIEYIPKDKQTEKVVMAYLKTDTKGYKANSYLESNKEIAAKLSLKTVQKFVEAMPGTITYFPQATREMWIKTAKAALNVEFKDIPEVVLCEELLAALMENSNNQIAKEIPERFWTETLIKTALDADPTDINNLPKSVVTKKWVIYALGKQVIPDLEIPNELWDEELVGVAADRTGLDNIPERLRTKEVCLKSIYADLFDRDAIPNALKKDKDIQMALACMVGKTDIEDKIPAIKKSEFQLGALQSAIEVLGTKIEKKDISQFIENIERFVTDWVPILKLWPEAIEYIDKPNQTTEMILAVLQNRQERDDLELIAKNLNLAKVTREMAPMLLNVEDKDVQDFVTRKLAPPKRAEGVGVNEIIVNVTPQEFNEISKRGVPNG